MLLLLFAQPTKKTYTHDAVGGLVAGGAALHKSSAVFVGGGGIVAVGSASHSSSAAIQATGGVFVGGNAGHSSARAHSGSGGLIVGGLAVVGGAFVVGAAGGIAVGGSADNCVSAVHDAIGGVLLGGAADVSFIRIKPVLTQLDRPSQVFAAIVDTLKAAIADSDYKTINIKVGDYEEWGPHVGTDRQILIEFGELEPDLGQNDGRHGQMQEIILYPVISTAVPKASREATNLASALARKLLRQRWGLPSNLIEPPAPTSIRATHAFFINGNEGAKGYEAWEVRFRQLIKYGAPVWPRDDEEPGIIALAINPMDPDNPAEYHDLE